MSAFDSIVLKQGSTIVAYLAPNFSVEPVLKNNPINFARPRGKGPLTKDLARSNIELVVQGTFQDSQELPDDHADALCDLFSEPHGTNITAIRQVNRVFYYAFEGGRFQLYDDTDEWSAETKSTLDLEDGKYPGVVFGEFRRTATAGVTKRTYTFRFLAGFNR